MFLEIGPLKERNYTGIAQVTAALAQLMLGDPCIEPFFFFGRTIVDNDLVAALLRERCGDMLEWAMRRAYPRPVPFVCATRQVALFTNRKTCRRAFDFEVQIIHDLSTLLTPQYHHQDTVTYHANTMAADIESNDLTVCVSEATRTDVLRYLGPMDDKKVVTIYNAADVQLAALPRRPRAKPYIVILGTIEPRKNVAEVLQMLRDYPVFCDQFDFIFLGRHGWGSSIQHLIDTNGVRHHVENGSIIFPGFVSEEEKNRFVRDAVLLVYPSIFEGFGLPVLEAMAYGTPCLTTRSSSMPEVGGEACFYFDPFAKGDFTRMFLVSLMACQDDHNEIADACRKQAAKFSWQRSYSQLLKEIEVRLPVTEDKLWRA